MERNAERRFYGGGSGVLSSGPGLWSLVSPRYDTPAERALEKELDTRIAFYQREQEQRKWYGLWNYGDWMHTYDPERHSWRYDMGGWAWQNTELVPTLWLWYMFLRSGREDVFSMAEDMCRHTSEVDIHHSGPFAGLGSRHNVKHWGGSAKRSQNLYGCSITVFTII